MGIDYSKKLKGLKFWFYTKTVYNLLIYEIGVLFITLVLLLKSYQKFSWLVVFGCLLGYLVLLGISYLLYIIYNMYKSKNHLDHLPDTVQKLDIGKEITYFIKDKTSEYSSIYSLISSIWFGFAGGYLIMVGIIFWGLQALSILSMPANFNLKSLIVILLCLILGLATRIVKRLCKA